MSFLTPFCEMDKDYHESLEWEDSFEEGLRLAFEFHRATVLNQAPKVSNSAKKSDPPDSWVRHERKQYPRFEDISLPDANEPCTSYADLLKERCSTRDFDSEKAVSLDQISEALELSMREEKRDDSVRKKYPSAGARYPTECYLFAIRVNTLSRGIYHYNPQKHLLQKLFGKENTKLESLFPKESVKNPAAIFTISSVFSRTCVKYGGRGYRFALLEAGASAMLLDLGLVSRGLDTVWIGGFPDDEIADALGLSWELELEAPIIAIAVGNVT